MKLLIDAGNTLIKSALLAGDECSPLPALPSDQAHTLAAHVAHILGVSEVWVSNVAGEDVARHIRAACAARGWPVHSISAKKRQCGVSNGYRVADQLGSDRWAALVAAWHMTATSTLVVNCGTATTIDALSAKGEFIGGLILPGLALMQSSIIATAAKLRPDAGRYAAFPVNTADAIYSGALQATCGAIQRQYELLGDGDVQILLSGGAAQELRELIRLPARPVSDLVLQGIKLIAQEAGAS